VTAVVERSRPSLADSLGGSRLLLVISATVFGSMFVPTQRAVEDLTPAGSVAIRFLVATAVMLPFSLRHDPTAPKAPWRAYAIAGLLAGGVNAFNFLVQGLALQRTSASSVAFLSSLFVVFVPALSAIVARRAPTRPVLIGIALAVGGSFLLAGGSLSLGVGDLLAISCAVGGSIHILVIGSVATRLRGPVFNAVQIAVVAVVAGVVGLFTGFGEVTAVALACMVYCGATQALALGLQVIAQRRVDPASSALILLLVPVVGAVTAVAILGDPVTAVRVAGALLIVVAVVVAEVLPARRAASMPTVAGGT
jgi:drug/metabolite transporter (DMT)-like permease